MENPEDIVIAISNAIINGLNNLIDTFNAIPLELLQAYCDWSIDHMENLTPELQEMRNFQITVIQAYIKARVTAIQAIANKAKNN